MVERPQPHSDWPADSHPFSAGGSTRSPEPSHPRIFFLPSGGGERMSRNFELMHEADGDFDATSIPKPRAIVSKAPEKVRSKETCFGLGQVAHEGALSFVQRIFLQQMQDPPH